MEILTFLVLTILFSLILNGIFRFNRTVFVLLASVVVFLFVSFFILFLGFEFLGLVFATIYVGGIVVMFLFLILIVDVRVENTQKVIFKNKDFLFTFIFSILFTFIFSIFFYYSYCPLLGNDVSFYMFFDKADVCKTDSSFINLFKFTGEINFDGNSLITEKVKQFYKDDQVADLMFNGLLFDEINILGVTFFEQHGLLLVLVGLFLLVATVVAVILCLNIFN